MSTLQRIVGAFLRPYTRRRAKNLPLSAAIERLEESKQVVAKRFADAKDTPANREAMNHVTGIERWGQSRLRVAMGAPLQIDSYRGYRLPEDASIEDLRLAFRETRNGTLALARELQDQDVDLMTTVRHNDLGELTVVEWLAYLDDHGMRESLRIRG
ncbi:MAG TPA: hypothetical protein VF168_10265 [Trueperaceae bacterium]